MKKTIFFLNLILFISCNKNNDNIDDNIKVVSNELKKRVLLLESWDPSVTSYVSDSIIEFYENKIIIRKDHYLKSNKDALYIGRFDTYEYNTNNYLIKVNHYNDINLNENYATSNYYYDHGNIKNRNYNRYNPSNFSNTLVNYTTHFEYTLDTINRYDINHLNNNAVENSEKHIVYGGLDSINTDNRWMYIFDNLKDINKTSCLGNDCNESYNTEYTYKNIREPLIDNIFGNDLNTFLIRVPFKYYYLEISRKQMTKISWIYPTNDRNGNTREYNYSFDEDNRLIEMYTGGTFAANDIIRYYYE